MPIVLILPSPKMVYLSNNGEGDALIGAHIVQLEQTIRSPPNDHHQELEILGMSTKLQFTGEVLGGKLARLLTRSQLSRL